MSRLSGAAAGGGAGFGCRRNSAGTSAASATTTDGDISGGVAIWARPKTVNGYSQVDLDVSF